MVEIRTTRLRLRHATAADLKPIHTILSDPRATAYWSPPPHKSLEQSCEWLQSMIDTAPPTGEDFVVGFDGKVIGKAGLYRFPEIGFVFHPDTWGQGFAAEALQPVIARAFSTHGLPTIEADLDPRNWASLMLLARLGFREVARKHRTWLVADQWCDSVYLHLDRARWRPGKSLPTRGRGCRLLSTRN